MKKKIRKIENFNGIRKIENYFIKRKFKKLFLETLDENFVIIAKKVNEIIDLLNKNK